MRPRLLKPVLSILLCVPLLASCGADRLIPEVRWERQTIPPALLDCQPPPAPRPIETQKDVALLMVDLAEAGEDCRGKLRAVKEVVGPP